MKNYWTKKECDTIISMYKDKTAYFTGELSFENMYDMLRNRMQFGEAEANIILACLIKCGAKIS